MVCGAKESLWPIDGADAWTSGAEHLVAAATPPSAQRSVENNAQRSGDVPAHLFYGDVGFTSSGESAYAGVAWMKGSGQGGSFEVASVSSQLGSQVELQAGAARASISLDPSTSCELRAVEADFHIGDRNPDGSTGVNFGAGLSGVAAECTVALSGNSITLGASVSRSAELSLGTRDSDSDGNREYCARVAAGPVVAGACIELEAAALALQELYERSGAFDAGVPNEP